MLIETAETGNQISLEIQSVVTKKNDCLHQLDTYMSKQATIRLGNSKQYCK